MYVWKLKRPADFLRRFDTQIERLPGTEPRVYGRRLGRLFFLSYRDLEFPRRVRTSLAMWGHVSRKNSCVSACYVYGFAAPWELVALLVAALFVALALGAALHMPGSGVFLVWVLFTLAAVGGSCAAAKLDAHCLDYEIEIKTALDRLCEEAEE